VLARLVRQHAVRRYGDDGDVAGQPVDPDNLGRPVSRRDKRVLFRCPDHQRGSGRKRLAPRFLRLAGESRVGECPQRGDQGLTHRVVHVGTDAVLAVIPA
jgi:hypothetical protein